MDMLRERIADKLLKYERFRQKAVIDTIGAVWVDDEHFDIARHVAPKSLHPEPGESPRRRCSAPAVTWP
jgi:diacylglycerol O-acyltransferase